MAVKRWQEPKTPYSSHVTPAEQKAKDLKRLSQIAATRKENGVPVTDARLAQVIVALKAMGAYTPPKSGAQQFAENFGRALKTPERSKVGEMVALGAASREASPELVAQAGGDAGDANAIEWAARRERLIEEHKNSRVGEYLADPAKAARYRKIDGVLRREYGLAQTFDPEGDIRAAVLRKSKNAVPEDEVSLAVDAYNALGKPKPAYVDQAIQQQGLNAARMNTELNTAPADMPGGGGVLGRLADLGLFGIAGAVGRKLAPINRPDLLTGMSSAAEGLTAAGTVGTVRPNLGGERMEYYPEDEGGFTGFRRDTGMSAPAVAELGGNLGLMALTGGAAASGRLGAGVAKVARGFEALDPMVRNPLINTGFNAAFGGGRALGETIGTADTLPVNWWDVYRTANTREEAMQMHRAGAGQRFVDEQARSLPGTVLSGVASGALGKVAARLTPGMSPVARQFTNAGIGALANVTEDVGQQGGFNPMTMGVAIATGAGHGIFGGGPIAGRVPDVPLPHMSAEVRARAVNQGFGVVDALMSGRRPTIAPPDAPVQPKAPVAPARRSRYTPTRAILTISGDGQPVEVLEAVGNLSHRVRYASGREVIVADSLLSFPTPESPVAVPVAPDVPSFRLPDGPIAPAAYPRGIDTPDVPAPDRVTSGAPILNDAIAEARRQEQFQLPREGQTRPDFHTRAAEGNTKYTQSLADEYGGFVLVDVPVGDLAVNGRHIDKARQDRLQSIGGSNDPIFVDQIVGDNGKPLLMVYNGNNRVQDAINRGKDTVSTYVPRQVWEDFTSGNHAWSAPREAPVSTPRPPVDMEGVQGETAQPTGQPTERGPIMGTGERARPASDSQRAIIEHVENAEGWEPPHDLGIDEQEFQFRRQTMPDIGVWDPKQAGTLGAWIDRTGIKGEAGKVWILDGHHRGISARDQNVEAVRVEYAPPEIDTPAKAKEWGMLRNLRMSPNLDILDVANALRVTGLDAKGIRSYLASHNVSIMRRQDFFDTALRMSQMPEPMWEAVYKQGTPETIELAQNIGRYGKGLVPEDMQRLWDMYHGRTQGGKSVASSDVREAAAVLRKAREGQVSMDLEDPAFVRARAEVIADLKRQFAYLKGGGRQKGKKAEFYKETDEQKARAKAMGEMLDVLDRTGYGGDDTLNTGIRDAANRIVKGEDRATVTEQLGQSLWGGEFVNEALGKGPVGRVSGDGEDGSVPGEARPVAAAGSLFGEPDAPVAPKPAPADAPNLRNGKYWYRLTIRPVGESTVPDGAGREIEYNTGDKGHGLVGYDQPLTAKEMDHFSLYPDIAGEADSTVLHRYGFDGTKRASLNPSDYEAMSRLVDKEGYAEQKKADAEEMLRAKQRQYDASASRPAGPRPSDAETAAWYARMDAANAEVKPIIKRFASLYGQEWVNDIKAQEPAVEPTPAAPKPSPPVDVPGVAPVEKGTIARMKPVERNDDIGTRYKDYRVRKVDAAEAKQLGIPYDQPYVVEERSIFTGKNPRDHGWHPIAHGETRDKAIVDAIANDDTFFKAESHSPEHTAAVARETAIREAAKRVADLDKAIEAAKQGEGRRRINEIEADFRKKRDALTKKGGTPADVEKLKKSMRDQHKEEVDRLMAEQKANVAKLDAERKQAQKELDRLKKSGLRSSRPKAAVAESPAPVAETSTPVAKAPETGAVSQEPWQMTGDEYIDSKVRYQIKEYGLPESEYAELRKDVIGTGALSEWEHALDARAKEGPIPENVLDDYVNRWGVDAMTRQFRGSTEKGREGYLPPDVRKQATEMEGVRSTVHPYQKTWEQYRKDDFFAIDRKVSPKEYREAKARHKATIVAALYEGKPVPAEVLADYPDLQPQPVEGVPGLTVAKVGGKNVFTASDGKEFSMTGAKNRATIYQEGLNRRANAPAEKPLTAVQKKAVDMLRRGVQIILEEEARPKRAMNSDRERKVLVNAYGMLASNARKLGLDVPPLGTWYKQEEYYRAAHSIDEQLQKKFGVADRVTSEATPAKPQEPAVAEKTAEEAAAARINAETPEAEIPMPALSTRPITPQEQAQLNRRRAAGEFTFESPEVEVAFTAAKKGIAPSDGPVARTLQAVQRVFNLMTRTYVNLPMGKATAVFRETLRQLGAQRPYQSRRVVEHMKDVVDVSLKGDRKAFDLFVRRIILNDLLNETGDLPYGFTRESLATESARLDTAIGADPRIKEAIDKRRAQWESVKGEYVTAMKDVGFSVEDRLTREDYFRHQVLLYANLRAMSGTSRRLETPTKRGFLKRRQGSTLDINANYFQAEFEVMSQMMVDTEIARAIKKIDTEYNVRAECEAKAKDARAAGNDDATWQDYIPEGYVTYQPREGTSFYLAQSIPERIATKLTADAMQTLGISAEDLKPVLARGGRFKEMVLPEGMAKTLDELKLREDQTLFRDITNSWKQAMLLAPRRFIRSQARNIYGDLEAVVRGNPSSFTKAKQAAAELWQMYRSERAATGEMREFMKRGGGAGTLQAQELGDLNSLRMVQRLIPSDATLAQKALKAPGSLWTRYWEGARMAADLREQWMRYSTYLDYLGQMQKSPDGTPRNFGASVPDDIMALKDVRDRAYKLANDLVLPYDEVTEGGRWLRSHMVPFWSFTERNFAREVQLMKNVVQEGGVAGAGRNLAVKAGTLTLRTTKYLAGAAVALSALQTFNMLKFPQEEDDLPDDVRKRPHLVLGRNEDGTVRYFDRLGNSQDFLEWFGLDTAPADIRDLLNGTLTGREFAQQVSTSGLNKAVQGLHPALKTGAELATKRRIFPDITNPRPIYDVPQYLAESLTVGPDFAAATGRPVKKGDYLDSLDPRAIGSYQADPMESAHYDLLEWRSTYMTRLGKPTFVPEKGPKGIALWQLKRALRFNDEKAAKRYYAEYLKLDGSEKGFQQSMGYNDLMRGVPKDDREGFKATLTGRRAAQLELAKKYAEQVNGRAKSILGIEIPEDLGPRPPGWIGPWPPGSAATPLKPKKRSVR